MTFKDFPFFFLSSFCQFFKGTSVDGGYLDYSCHALRPVLVVSDQGCATLSGLRPLCEIIGVKGGLHLFQQRVHNKYSAAPCRCQRSSKVTTATISIFTIWSQNSFLAPSSHVSLVRRKSHFSLHAACKAAIWKEGPGCSRIGSPLW